MTLTVTHRYDFKPSPFEQVAVEVLNDRYGRVIARQWHKVREYAVELATLQPEPSHSLYLAWRWLAAAGISLLVMAGFVVYLKHSSSGPSWLVTAGTVAVLLALTALFVYLFVILSRRCIVFHARFSGTPLVEIPVPLRNRTRGIAFAREFGQLAEKNRARLHHSDDELRAGELRMLRRLSEEGNLAANVYHKAKALLLQLSN